MAGFLQHRLHGQKSQEVLRTDVPCIPVKTKGCGIILVPEGDVAEPKQCVNMFGVFLEYVLEGIPGIFISISKNGVKCLGIIFLYSGLFLLTNTISLFSMPKNPMIARIKRKKNIDILPISGDTPYPLRS